MTAEGRSLFLVGGLVATGKSTLSRSLAERIGATRIEADSVRDSLLDAATEPSHEARWVLDFQPGFEDRVYEELLLRARRALLAGHDVVLDACFPRAVWRLRARDLAAEQGARFRFIECRIAAASLRERLAARDRAAGHAGWQEIHRDLAARFEPPDELRPEEHVVVPGDANAEATLRAIEAPPKEASPTVSAFEASPKVVTFDCWNTLLVEEDWTQAHALRVEALRDAAREAGREVDREEASRAFDHAWGRHMRLWRDGEATGASEIAVWGLAQLGLHDPHPALEHLVRHFETASHTSHVVALPGAPELISALSAAGMRCALVCDTGLTPGREVRRLLDRAGLLDGLAVQVFSDEVGVPKPHALAFRAALEPLGAAPAEAVHVGDLLRTDVAGARAVGMASVRIRARHDDPDPLPEADHVVDSHAELGALLGVALPGEAARPPSEP